jgi:hypothetical protein
MSFGSLLKRRMSKLEDLQRDKRQEWKCEKQEREKEKKVKKKM